jgi:hypothetical protein
MSLLPGPVPYNFEEAFFAFTKFQLRWKTKIVIRKNFSFMQFVGKISCSEKLRDYRLRSVVD